MNHLARVSGALVVIFAAANGAVQAEPAHKSLGDLSKVGTVNFPISCAPGTQKDFDRAVALLHSFFYDEARRSFESIVARDPKCGIAHWGVAMTLYHPVWAAPSEEELKLGLAAANTALTVGAKTPRELGYINAVRAFYTSTLPSDGVAGESCHGLVGTDHRGRALAYEKVMEKLQADYPKDVEAKIFYALALLGTAPPGDPALTNQTKAAAIMEPLFAKFQNHPGLAHYLIHAYDYPSTAARGLPAAKSYAAMAPWVPHALHMPSHIFTRLGMWQEAVDANLASADAARSYAASRYPGSASFEELHALDYLVYAYLQTGHTAKAKEALDRTYAIGKTFPEVDFVVAYAAGAIPARFALERRQWAEAAKLPLQQPTLWGKFPFAEAHLEFAHAVGAARSGNAALARKAAERLQALADKIPQADPKFQFFTKQVRMQQLAATGWVAYAEGKKEEALKILRTAADAEDKLGKHPVSPGAIYPVRELLGDLLVELKRPADALVEYEASLKIYPARFNGLYGAGYSAELAGQKDLANKYYKALVALAAGDNSRVEVGHAKEFLASSGAQRL